MPRTDAFTDEQIALIQRMAGKGLPCKEIVAALQPIRPGAKPIHVYSLIKRRKMVWPKGTLPKVDLDLDELAETMQLARGAVGGRDPADYAAYDEMIDRVENQVLDLLSRME